MRICCLSAHPDDLEIGCSGTLMKYQEQGAVVDSIVLVEPAKDIRPNRSKTVVDQELAISYALTNFNLRVYNTPQFYNGRPNLTCDTNTITEVSELITDKNYDLVILPSPTDWHQDHRTTYEIGMSIFARRARELWTMDAWPYCLRSNHGNIQVDISDQWIAKEKVIRAYRSYITDDDVKSIARTNQYWAVKINTDYAESFNLVNKAC